MTVGTGGGYVVMQIAVLLTVYLFTFDTSSSRDLYQRRFLLRAFALTLLWFAVEQAGVRLGIWYYPEGGTLPIRIAELPLEEYFMFFTHAVLCQLLVAHVLRGKP